MTLFRPLLRTLPLATTVLLFAALPAAAQSLNIDLGGEPGPLTG